MMSRGQAPVARAARRLAPRPLLVALLAITGLAVALLPIAGLLVTLLAVAVALLAVPGARLGVARLAVALLSVAWLPVPAGRRIARLPVAVTGLALARLSLAGLRVSRLLAGWPEPVSCWPGKCEARKPGSVRSRLGAELTWLACGAWRRPRLVRVPGDYPAVLPGRVGPRWGAVGGLVRLVPGRNG